MVLRKIVYLSLTSMVLIIFFQITTSSAQNVCCVSGEALLSEEKTVYLYLLDSDGFREFKKNLPSAPFKLVITPDPKQIKEGKVPFSTGFSPGLHPKRIRKKIRMKYFTAYFFN